MLLILTPLEAGEDPFVVKDAPRLDAARKRAVARVRYGHDLVRRRSECAALPRLTNALVYFAIRFRVSPLLRSATQFRYAYTFSAGIGPLSALTLISPVTLRRQ